ncbi:hypothetical protein [Citrobacter cronae]|uniref:hypothetical protein n=1 Tax=Citrobacter cronae TaxID=1748967 RepID=UPI001C12578E|nr:hypothetical protein [Citrobacter cronae]MBU5384720.1 hypothetical protein [Citrobacter cronae]
MKEKTMKENELPNEMNSLREDVYALTVAFSYLAYALPEENMRMILTRLRYESVNSMLSSQQQNSFKRLAEQLEEKLADIHITSGVFLSVP